jgi:hypothetical protein
MKMPEAGRSINDVRSVLLRRAGEEGECEVSGGQEARAASAAGDGSPRGPGVQTSGAFQRELSSAGWHRRACRPIGGKFVGCEPCVQTGSVAGELIAMSRSGHEPFAHPPHPSAFFIEGDISPTPRASPARA